MVARFPMTEAFLGETAATSPYFTELASGDAQSWTGWSQSSGVGHFVSAHLLSQHRLAQKRGVCGCMEAAVVAHYRRCRHARRSFLPSVQRPAPILAFAFPGARSPGGTLQGA